MDRRYLCIDLKSYYASVECVARGLDPLKALLVVADETRTDGTICLAVSPALKAMGVPARPRLFEAKQKIREYEILHHTKVDWIIAPPRMAEYERISARIYGIYLKYAAAEDIHIYSIDECFVDCTAYLHFYEADAAREGVQPARRMAMTMIRAVLAETGITATAGIGTNLYLAKIAMDIVAKKQPADRDGVRIAELDEDSYKFLLWDHRPLTDFWQIGAGKARRLQAAQIYTMGEIAERTIWDEEFFYKTFGVDGEILIDHAWGIEPVTMKDIKSYRTKSRSLSSGQVLPRAYAFEEARLVLMEMIDALSMDMVRSKLAAPDFSWWVSYDPKSLEVCPAYSGPLSVDFYGNLHPAHAGGTVHAKMATNSESEMTKVLLSSFDRRVDRRLLIRRLGISAEKVVPENAFIQLSFFTDDLALDREKRLRRAVQEVRLRYGPNAVFLGMNLLQGGTALERNLQIGGHKA